MNPTACGWVLLAVVAAASPARAHHGVAGVGAAGLRGPGAPVESASSATVPAGSGLGYLKLDYAKYKTFDADPSAPESDYAQFWMSGVGYGFTPWFSAYVFAPYHVKIDEPGGFDTRGWADMSLFAQLGFKYDEGWELIPANESLDDLEDWHFTAYGGLTLPTGEPNLRDSSGAIDPGKSTGFGKPSWSIGATATKLFAERWTFNAELSYIGFQEYRYDDPQGLNGKFGAEARVNGALIYRWLTNEEHKTRLDLILEGRYLHLGRDRTNGIPEIATGGQMLYLEPGVRLYWDKLTLAFAVAKPAWTRLNEEGQQQGGEGKERYRLIFTASLLF